MSLLLVNGDSRKIPLADESVHCIVTSPPYWGLRNYSEDGQIGLEQTPSEYIHEIVLVFRELWRVLHQTGTAWLNLGDSYVGYKGKNYGIHPHLSNLQKNSKIHFSHDVCTPQTSGMKSKDLVGIPWRVALALQADGWWLRSDIVWQKPSPMPESVNGWRWEQHRIKISKSNRAVPDSYHSLAQPNGKAHSERNGKDFADQFGNYMDCPGCVKCADNDGLVLRRGSWRPTSSYEHIFMLAKSADYFCDKDAVTEPLAESSHGRKPVSFGGAKGRAYRPEKTDPNFRNGAEQWGRTFDYQESCKNGRNQRDIWTIAHQGWSGAHYATFPPEIPRRCIKAGTSEKGVCPDCGNPWARIVTKTTAAPRPDNPNQALPYSADSGLTQGTGATTLHKHRGTITNGWKATCTCSKDPVPAVVLDPFVGSGTTLQVARELRRNGIGLDLNWTYLQKEARKRLNLDLLEAFEQGTGISVSQEATRKRTVSDRQLVLL